MLKMRKRGQKGDKHKYYKTLHYITTAEIFPKMIQYFPRLATGEVF